VFESNLAWTLILFLAIAACDCETLPMSDGGADAMPDASGGAIMAPVIPWLDGVPTTFDPCPTGYRAVVDGALTTCDPYPEGGPSACAEGEAHFPGEPGCRTIGDACPPGDFATSLPAGGSIIYVDEAAAAGGDGSMAAPFTTLADVSFGTLAAGTTVALARGNYGGTLPLRAGVQVVGACTAQTILAGEAPAASAVTVTSSGEPTVLRNVTIRDAPQAGVRVAGGRHLRLEGIAIERSQEFGVYVSGSGSEVVLVDVVVRGTRADSGGLFARGLSANDGGRLEATRVIVEENRELGIGVGSGAEAVATDVVVRNQEARDVDRSGGRGLSIQGGARFEGTRLLVEGNRNIGLHVSGSGTEAIVSDVIVRDTRANERDGEWGAGINVQEGASFEASRLLVEGNHDAGVLGFDPGTRISLVDAVIRDTESQVSDGLRGRGANVQAGASLSATRMLVARNRDVGLVIAEGESTLTDVAVSGTRGQEIDGQFGRGLVVHFGGRVEASRVLAAGNREAGILVNHAGTELVLTDAVIRDTGGADPGHGINVDAARLIGERIVVEGAAGVGVASLNADVTLSHVRIERIESPDCAATTCPEREFGYGAISVSGRLRMTNFAVIDASTCGIFLTADTPTDVTPSVDLMSGDVTGAAIGACVQVDDYDLMRLSNDVRYQDNDTNVQATTLPVPEPPSPTMTAPR